jgi:glycosyltransferase involved in cell wall biosynthesis
MQPEVVSIMMPAYNAERYIGQAIESVLAQRYTKWELIVVDDGSTDGTPGILAQYHDARIRVIHQANAGEAGARNVALQAAQGEYVAFLDADDAYLPEHLQATVDYLRENTACGAVYSDGYYCDQDGVQLKPLSSRRRGPFEGDIFEQMVRASDVFGAPVCVVLRADAIAREGLRFDREIVIGPDWDFLTRLTETARVGYVNQRTCLYRVHQTNISLRTNTQKRALSLARCREKAIKMYRFDDCSIETRVFVFYDLLVNLLVGMPERQAQIIQWPEFCRLPPEKQSQLLRLMASETLIKLPPQPIVKEWFNRSHELNPSSMPGALMRVACNVSPSALKFLLGLRAGMKARPASDSPFGDLFER